MKKKAIERIAEEKQRIIENLEQLLGERKKQIAELKYEIEGGRQMIQMLQSFVLEGVERSGRVEIPKKRVSEGLKCGYTLTETEDAYILERVEAEENG